MMTDKKEGPNIKQVNWDGRTIFLEETFKGCVIRIFEKNGYDDSDFFATVWNEEKQQFENIEYSTTRAWCYPNNAIVDATPEIQTKWDIMCRESEQKRRKAMIENEKHIPRIGKNVQVVKGRKVPIGTIGTIIREYKTHYGRNESLSILIKTNDNVEYWTNVNNVKTIIRD